MYKENILINGSIGNKVDKKAIIQKKTPPRVIKGVSHNKNVFENYKWDKSFKFDSYQ